MAATPFLSVVIPAYNEIRRLPATLAATNAYLAQQSFPAEIIVVDDGSTDGTAGLAASHAGVHVLRCEHRGKGFAVRAGALAARGEYVLLCDADLATPIEEWEELWPYFRAGFDVVIGSREGIDAQRYNEPFHRHLMGRIFNLLVQMITLPGIHDTQCGFKALRLSVVHDLFRRMRIYDDDAPIIRGAAVTAYDVELLFLARQRGYRIAEAPVLWHYGAETKVDPVRDSSWRNLRDVLRVRFNDWRGAYQGSAAATGGLQSQR